jgi:Tfp pilus assembly protein FimV
MTASNNRNLAWEIQMAQQRCIKAFWSGVIYSVFSAALWASTATMAAGLGPMTIRSLLGEPLVADIALVANDKRELNGLSARIAPVAAHRRADIPYLAALGLRAAIQTDKSGRLFVRVVSVQPVTEPAMTLLIELIGPDAQTIREYAALFEPPETQRRP